jgi:hypothetical protein
MSCSFSPKELICLIRLLPPEARLEIFDNISQNAINTKHNSCFMAPKDLMSFLRLLHHDTQKEILDHISQKAINTIKEKTCPICFSNMDSTIPVRMSSPNIYCAFCGDHSNCFACLGCIHAWLQLSIEPSQRELRKHLICNKVIDPGLIYNTLMAYTIDENLIDYLDRHHPMNIKCMCGLEDTRQNILNHIISGSCLSFR